MKKLLVLLSCGHRIEENSMRLGAPVRFFTEARDEKRNVACHHGGSTHEAFVMLVLTSTTDRIWLEEA